MKRGGLDHVRRDPKGCCQWLSAAGVVGAVRVTLVRHAPEATTFEVRFDPPPSVHLPGYPAEQVRITVRANGAVFAVPVCGDARAWLHRFPRLSTWGLLGLPPFANVEWSSIVGALCLEYPRDPEHLRWNWSDGIDAYLRIVQRHLWCEEYWRRHGFWPVADVPHGERPDGRAHPILTPTRMAA